MKLIQNTRKQFGKYLLKKQMYFFNRNRYFSSFEKAGTIGILFNATDKEEFDLIKKYIKYLRGLKKKVKSIGYYSTVHIPDTAYSKVDYDFFTIKDLNWHLRPMKGFVDNFIEEEFDVLLDLNLKNDFPLFYISSLSKAKFKIGRMTENTELYDLMIEVEEDTGIKQFLKHVDHYLLQMSDERNNKEEDQSANE
jgi:hypothetical protein